MADLIIPKKLCFQCWKTRPLASFQTSGGRRDRCTQCNHLAQRDDFLPRKRSCFVFCPLTHKRCIDCKQLKRVSEFYRNKRFKPLGYQSECIDCTKAQRRAMLGKPENRTKRLQTLARYRTSDKGRATIGNYQARDDVKEQAIRRALKDRLQRYYNMTMEQYEEMVEQQNGLCAICLDPPKDRYRRLYIDHSHATGRVRQLLCKECNDGLGRFKDDPKLLERAKQYLMTHA